MAPVTVDTSNALEAGTGLIMPSGGSTARQVSTGETEARKQVRGSSLLLLGRVLSRGSNFLVQVLTVRYLTVSDYGAFAYALSLVTLGQTIATCGLDRAVTRFVPMYQERKDYDRLFGTLLMTGGTILSLGVLIALGVLLFSSGIDMGQESRQATALLMILIFLVPLQALDDLVVGLFAVFAAPRAIFFRRHVLAPGLKLAVVLLLVALKASVLFLAVGYVVASLIGVAWYGVMLYRLTHANGLMSQLSWKSVVVPWREVLSFTVPLLTSDLVFVVLNSVTVISLQHFHGLTGVAGLRAQQPIAAMNHLVMVSFQTLFTPLASRLFARDDRAGINELYWKTGMWMAVLTFPIFVLTFSTAGPLTSVLFGARYEGSAALLTVLALGYYFDAALGFNGLVLKIYGMLRYVMLISFITVGITLVANLALIPKFGAFGAAGAITIGIVAHNILKQTGLRLGTGINVFEWRYFRGYCVIVAAAVAVFTLQWVVKPPVYVSLAAAAVASWIVFWLNRHLLELDETFPELARQPVLKRLLGLAGTR
ncbi:MAG: flippase [Vicinamibacterales bacterium]